MNIEMTTRIPREIRAIDPATGDPTQMYYHDPIVQISTGLRSRAQCVQLDGQWFVRADETQSEQCEEKWAAAEHAVDRSFEFMLSVLRRR